MLRLVNKKSAKLKYLSDEGHFKTIPTSSRSRTGEGLLLLSILSGCGGSADRDDEGGLATGFVIDGYVSGARVFRDSNGNNRYDFGEEFSITDGSGFFSSLGGSELQKIVADNNDGRAIDTATGFPLATVMSSPGNYSVITPITTFVVELEAKGYDRDEAEKAVISAFGLPSDLPIQTFDPFATQLSDFAGAAELYKSQSVKVVNTLLASNNDFNSFSLSEYVEVLSRYVDLIEERYASGSLIDLHSVATLQFLLPTVASSTIADLAIAHSPINYLEVLDGQLLLLAANSQGILKSNTQYGEELVSVTVILSENQNIDPNHEYKATLTNAVSGKSVHSTELVASGAKVAIFRFTDIDIRSLKDGVIDVGLIDLTSNEALVVINEIILEVLSPTDTPTVSTQVGAGPTSSPDQIDDEEDEVVVSDSGLVADGYISGARVFRDENENETFDAGEDFVRTNALGEFTGLGGSADKPIVADGNNGTAVDTSTGSTFNAVLSAPAGSKVVNPVTTIINELMQDSTSGVTTVAEANLKVAKVFGMEAVTDAGIDFTKFDPISKNTFSTNGISTRITDDNLADITQGVATFVANLIVSGAAEKSREAGGSATVLANTTKSIIKNIKDLVKARSADIERGDDTKKFDYSKSADIREALGTDLFDATSTTLSTVGDSFSTFNPKSYDANDAENTTGGLLSQSSLLEKQILSQSEFGDGVLTTDEAANGSTYVIGPVSGGDAVTGTATIRFSNEVVRYKTVDFANSKYATVELDAPNITAEQGSDGILKDIGGGSINVVVKLGSATNSSEWNDLGDAILSETTYFHKDIVPTISFDNGGLTPTAGKIVKASDAGSTFILSGSVTINIGDSRAPVTLNKIAGGLSSADGDEGRAIILEFIEEDGDTVFTQTTNVVRSNDSASSNTGSESFAWSTDIEPTTASEVGSLTFAEISDGDYTIRGTFVDAYGATSAADASVYTGLTLDRNAPEVTGTPSFSTNQVNSSDQSVDLVINLTEAAADRTDAQNNFIEIVDTSATGTRTLTQAISAGDATATFNSAKTQLTINYEPTASGNLSVNIKPGAFQDATGNTNTNSTGEAISTSSVAFDMDAPSVSSVSIVNGAKTISDSVYLNTKDFDEVSEFPQLVVTFDEAVTSFSSADVLISRISNTAPIQFASAFTSSDDLTWTASLTPATGIDGVTTVSVSAGSYTDTLGNVGTGASSNFAIDTRVPQIFSAVIDPSTEQSRYGISELGVSDTIDILVTFDEALSAFTGTPSIALSGFSDGIARNATLVETSVSGLTQVKFSYAIGINDRASSGIDVAGAISGGTFSGVNGNPVSLDLTSISVPLDLSGKAVDASRAGSVVDGYVEGGIIFADNNQDGQLSSNDPIAQADATGGFEILGASGALVLEGGFDISTNKDFNVRYSAPSGYSVINPISTLIVEEADGDFSLGNIAKAESNVYNLIGAPLGTDIGSSGSFAISPSSASEDGTLTAPEGSWQEADVGKYIEVEYNETEKAMALLLDTNGSYRIIENFSGTSEIPSGAWSIVDKKSGLLKSYNAYEAIAEASEGSGDVSSIRTVVDQALDYQKVAASVALITDVLSTAASSTADETRSAADISNVVFAEISANLSALMDEINSAQALGFYPGGTLDADINDVLIANISTKLAEIFDPSSSPPIASIAGMADDFPELFDVIGAAIVAIHAANSKAFASFTDFNNGAGLSGTETTESARLAVSEDGINALTEIVQVQSVVQGDITSEIVQFYETKSLGDFDITPSDASAPGQFIPSDSATWDSSQVGNFIVGNSGVARLIDVDGAYDIVEGFTDTALLSSGSWVMSAVNPNAISVDRLLGVSGDPSNTEPTDYIDVPVGTVVPIRYNIEEPTQFSKFEGDGSGNAAEFSFVITRAGSIKTTSSLEYEITGGISANDIAGGILSGELFFDVNEKQKTLNITLNNDAIREPDETLSVRIFDPTETSQIVNDTASVIIRDDDPSTPEIVSGRTSYSVTEGGTVVIDDVNLDYFDTNAKFKIEATTVNGTLTTTIGGVPYSEGDYVNYFDLQTSLLRNLEFVAPSSPSEDEAVSIITITASENGVDPGRTSSESLEITYDIHRLPTVDVTSLNTNVAAKTFYAGVSKSIPGITISDADSEFLTVKVQSDLEGEFASTSGYSIDITEPNSVTISGSVAEVQNALDGLTFTAFASSASGATLSVFVDDGDELHARNTDGSLSASSTTKNSDKVIILASPPSVSQGFTPKLTVDSDPNANIWGSFPGLEVADLDSVALDVYIFGAAAKIDFRLYDSGLGDQGLVASSATLDETRILKLSGSPAELTEQLKLLQAEIQEKQTGLAEFVVTDGTTATPGYAVTLTPSASNENGTFTLGGGQAWDAADVGKIIVGNGGIAKLTNVDGSYQIIQEFTDGSAISSGSWSTLEALELAYTPIDNIVPEPGGRVVATSVSEDTEDTIYVSGINLVDGDAFEADGITPKIPKDIQILSVEGGTIASITTPTGEPINLSVSELSSATGGLSFTPNPQFNGNAIASYVVVDPEQGTYTSAVSELVIPVLSVNDKPSLTLSTRPLTYEQGQASVTIFENVVVSDVDSSLFSEVRVGTDRALLNSVEQFVTPKLLGITPTPSTSGQEITYSGSMTLADVRTILSNIKFATTSTNVRDDVRTFNLTLTDADETTPLASDSVSKTMSFIDVNDAPSLSSSVDQSEADFSEADAIDVLMSSFGNLSDPEGDNISQIKVKISSGYRLGQDELVFLGGSTFAAGATNVSVSSEFDTSTGQLTLSFAPSIDLDALSSNILDYVAYRNTSDNPNVSQRKITISVTDEGGATSTSEEKTINISAQNDAPELFSLVQGAEVTSSLGEQFIEGGRAVKIAGDLVIRDVDTRLMDSATVSSSSGTLGLSASGISLASAHGITVDDSVSGTLSLSKAGGVEIDKLQSVVREATIGNLSRQVGEITSNQEISIVIKDAEGEQSNAFKSNIKILAAPSVQVLAATDASGDYSDLPALTEKVLKFNDTFAASELFVNLEQSSIRTELGRFVYDNAKNTNKLSEAQHVDLRDMTSVSEAAGATTNVIGQENDDVIYGSSFSDFVDGNGGNDIIKTGAGDDFVSLRTGSTLVLDGGEGADTLILPLSFYGAIDLSSVSIANLTLSNFENLDARSATDAVTLTGSSTANILLGGSGEDTLALGAGGDVVEGGSGADTFVVDVSLIPQVGSVIRDLQSVDFIKFVDGAAAYTIDRWLGLSDAVGVSTDDQTIDAWMSYETDVGKFFINVETPSGVKKVDIGPNIFGTPSKWVYSTTQDDTYFVLQPELNAKATFGANSGPTTSQNKPLLLSATESGYGVDLDGTAAAKIEVVDPDNALSDKDELTVELSVSSANRSIVASVDGYGDTSVNPITLTGAQSSINAALQTLTISDTGAGRGTGTLNVTVSDAYTNTSDVNSKSYTFEVPNSAPVLNLGSLNSEYSEASPVGTSISLSQTGLLSPASGKFVSDDNVDLAQNSVELKMSFDGAIPITPNQPGYVTVIGQDVFIGRGEDVAIVSDWEGTLQNIASQISFGRETVGSVKVSISLTDEIGLISNIGESTFAFAPRDLPTPELNFSLYPGQQLAAAGEVQSLSGPQFDGADIRVFLVDEDGESIGASVGDTIEMKVDMTTFSGPLSKTITKTIPGATQNLSNAAPFIDFSAVDLLPAGAARDGTIEIRTTLIPAAVPASTSSAEKVTFIVDSTAPAIPAVTDLPAASAYHVTNGDVTTLTVDGGDTDLNLAVVKIFGGADAAWYDLPSSLVVKPLGTGKFSGEVAPFQVTSDGSTYTLSFDTPIAEGVYSVIARDQVLNVSDIDVSGFDLSASQLPSGIFIVDKSLDASSLKYAVTSTTGTATDTYKVYEHNGDESRAVTLEISGLGGELPTDIVTLTVEAWGGVGTPDTTRDADLSGTFSRSFPGDGSWTPVDVSGVSLSASNSLVPSITLDTAAKLDALSDRVSVKITATDVAGNTVSINTLANEIILDRTADGLEDGAPNSGLVTTLVEAEFLNGISSGEASDLSIEMIGFDRDLASNITHFIAATDLKSNLQNLGLLELSELTPDVAPLDVDGTKVLSFNLGSVYLDLNNTKKVSSEYIKDVSLGSQNNLNNIDLSTILPPSGSSDETLYIIHEIQDKAGNVSFRGDLLSKTGLDEPVLETLRLDVTAAQLLESMKISAESDTGLKGDLVTSVQKPEITFFTDEEIRTDANVVLDDGISTPRLVQLSTLASEAATLKYELVVTASEEVTLEEGGKAYKYTAVLGENTNLSHGLWGVEVTDLAGNVTTADASGILGSGAPYFSHSDLNAETNGVMLIDREAPGDAVISAQGIESEGGFLNSTEVSGDTSVTIVPDIDFSSSDEVVSNRIASIDRVDLDGVLIELAEGAKAFTFDSATPTLAEGVHTITVTTSDIAGNETTTEYTFIKDTIAADPTKISILGIGDDTTINQAEYISDLVIKSELAVAEDSVVSVTLKGLGENSAVTEELALVAGGPVLNAEALGLADGEYQLEVVTSDPAGNLRSDFFDFTIDTQPPEMPDVFVERSEVVDGVVTLGAWDALNEYRGSEGVKFQFTPKDISDVVNVETVKVNGTNASLVDLGRDIYFIEKEYLQDDGPTNDNMNTIEFSVTETSGNTATFSSEFLYDEDQPSEQHFAIVSSAYSVISSTDTRVILDVYVSEYALQRFDDVSDYGGTAFDLNLAFGGTSLSFNQASDTVSANSQLYSWEADFKPDQNSLIFGGFSDEVYTDTASPLLSIALNVADFDAVKSSGGTILMNYAKISEVPILTSEDAIGLSNTIDLSELIITPMSEII